METTGQQLIDSTFFDDLSQEELNTLTNLYKFLSYAHRSPFLTKSTFARYEANMVGLCASEGWITTKINNEVWGNKWVITDLGLDAMNQMEIYDDGK